MLRLLVRRLRRPSRAPRQRMTGDVERLNFLSLFSGIGGLDRGLELAGMSCVGQVERDAWCRSVLRRHWPEVPQHEYAESAAAWWGRRARPFVHLVAGGPPCQPFSHSGLGYGVADPRWQWPNFIAVVDAVRDGNGGAWPWVLVENVRGLLKDAEAFGRILGDLADRGFDAEWSVVSACAVGAPHVRRRLFVVAYPASCRRGRWSVAESGETAGWEELARGRRWQPEPDVRRVANGIPDRGERVKALGNAVVTPVAELVGGKIAAAYRSSRAA